MDDRRFYSGPWLWHLKVQGVGRFSISMQIIMVWILDYFADLGGQGWNEW